MSVVPTRFEWRYGGRNVHLCGSFTRWQETIPLTLTDEGVHVVIINLPPGYHQYKYIVDEEWRHDEGLPSMPDPLGNVNNWVLVKKPDEAQLAQLSRQASQEHDASSAHAGRMDVDQDTSMTPRHSVASHLQPTHIAPLIVPPLAHPGINDAASSRRSIREYLSTHTAYELIPESSKVLALDVTLPVKQAFHALYEMEMSVAPLWDSQRKAFVGMISASDFITILRQLRSDGAELNDAILETPTIEEWRESLDLQDEPLVAVRPDYSLFDTAKVLLQYGYATVPILSLPDGGFQTLLHLASLSGILSCICRYFKHLPSALPLLQQPIGTLPLGTWGAHLGNPRAGAGAAHGGQQRQLATVRLDAPLTTALGMLLQAQVSSLPVVNNDGALVDVYARSDITSLARDKAYARMQLDDITVKTALALSHGGSRRRGFEEWAVQRICSRSDTLKSALEKLANPGVRRLVCVENGTRRVEGVISLSDILSFLLLPNQ
eukprot:jgi/Chlat1/8051/Chrsp73S07535